MTLLPPPLPQAEIEQLMAAEAERSGMEERRDAMSGDISKFEKLIEKLHSHKEMMEQKIHDKKAEVAEREAELQEAVGEKGELAGIVSRQEMSVGDVQRLQHDRQQMDDNLRRATEAKERVDKQLYTTEDSVANMTEAVEEAVRVHGAKCEQLKMLPQTAKHAGGLDFSLRFNRAGDSPDTLLDKDVKHTLKPQLAEVKSQTVAKYHGIQVLE